MQLDLARKTREERLTVVAPFGLADFELAAATFPAHPVLLCDRSDSTLGVSCDDRALTSAVDTWIARGAITPGSSFEALIPGSRRDTATRVLAVETHAASRAERAATLLGLRASVSAATRSALTRLARRSPKLSMWPPTRLPRGRRSDCRLGTRFGAKVAQGANAACGLSFSAPVPRR
jgi:hypothetical protein